MSSISESSRRKLKKLELSEEQIQTLGHEFDTMFESLTEENKRAEISDVLKKTIDCSQSTTSGDDEMFTKIFYITSVTDKIAVVTQSLRGESHFPVTFSVLCTIFQNLGNALQRSNGPFTYPSPCSDKEQYKDPDTHAQAVGLETLFKTARAYLNGIEENASKSDIDNLQNRVPYEKGAEFLGTLKAKIENLLPKTDFESAYYAITYINIYARLAILRSVVLWQLYCLKKQSKFGQASAKSIYLTMKTNEELDMEVATFITIPMYERAVFLTLFHPSENRQFMNFLKANGIRLPTLAATTLLDTRVYVIRPMAWLYWSMEMGWDIHVSLWGCNKDTEASRFQFEPVSNRKSDNIFYIRSHKWTNYYVYMGNNPWGFCAGVKGAPDTEGQWKVVQFEVDGQTQYVMSPLKWPCYFIYMTNSLWGRVRGTYDTKERDHNGLWKIAERK